MRRLLAAAMFFGLCWTTQARAADTFNYDGIKYQGTVLGLRDGYLWVTLTGTSEKLYDLGKVQNIQLGSNAHFSDAEQARADDAKKAAALYKEAIKELNSAPLKQLAELRAIEPAETDGKWTDAVAYFLDVYETTPADVIWKSRPTHMPAAPSTLLKDSAEKVGAVIKSIKSEEARKNLKTFQLDIYTRANDTEDAQRLAREITTGVVEDPTPVKPRETSPAAANAAAVGEIETALRAKNYDAAVKQCDALLETVNGATAEGGAAAVQAYMYKARAYEEQGNLDLATATLLRIPAHYPGADRAAAAALYQAAELQKRNNHPAEAAQLYHEIIVNYPDSKEAPQAKQAGGK